MKKLIHKHTSAIQTVGKVVVGTALGVAIKSFTQSPLSALLVIIGLLSIVILVILSNQVKAGTERKEADEKVISSTNDLTQIVKHSRARTHDDLKILSDMLTDRMVSLESQIGLRVERLLTSEVNGYKTIGEDKSAKMILSARERLYVLDLISEQGYWPDDAMKQSIIDAAFRDMISLAEQTPSLSYKRIVQVADPGLGLHNAGNPIFIKHCHDIVRLHEMIGRRAVLRMARRRFPFKLVLIDNEYMIIQLQEYDRNDASLRLWGELRVTDPRQNLISIFNDIWHDIDNDAVPVELSHLPPVTLATGAVKPKPSRRLPGSALKPAQKRPVGMLENCSKQIVNGRENVQ
jgi:hypothetical protein